MDIKARIDGLSEEEAKAALFDTVSRLGVLLLQLRYSWASDSFGKSAKECRIKFLKEKGKQKGMAGTRIYRIWHNIIHRCDNPKARSYKNYGAKGIKYCATWGEFKNFYKDMIPTYQDGLQIDRIDNSKGYCPENCRWVTPKENSRNKTTNVYLTWNGKRMLIIDWCRSYGTHIYRQIRKHRYDGTMIIEGGKYNNV